MRAHRIDIDLVDVPASGFDRIIEWLLISLLAFAPLAFGAVEAWSEEVVIILAAAISICFLLKLVVEKDTRLVWSWAYVPVALFILVAVFQLVRLPASLVGAVSPNTAAIKSELLADLPNSSNLLESMTMSFYTNATKHDLRLVLAVAAVFFVVVNVYRRPDQIKRLLGAVAIIGGTIALLALAQDLSGTGKIYWMVTIVHPKAYSGPFICHSHYGQFMNLSIGAALALIMVKLHETFAGRKVTASAVAEYLGSPQAYVLWALAGMIILGAATVFVSLTRGGMVSMLTAAGFTTLVLSWRRSVRGRGWIMVLLALGAFVGVLFMGFDAVYDRLATLRQLDQAASPRWKILKGVATAWTRFPLLGTGLGTHEVVYPMFDRATMPALASHAENEYAQAAEETGIVGVVLLLALWVTVWVSHIRNVKSGSAPIRSAAYGLGFGLIAIMVHSFSDFGQHLPANAMLSAVSCGLLIGLASTEKRSNLVARSAAASRVSIVLRGAAVVCASVVFAWALLGANSARLAETHWKKALAVERRLSARDWQGSDEEYIELIRHAGSAADYEPGNVKYRHWLNVYRWESISRITDPNTGELAIPEQSMEFVHRIVDELNSARALCPTYGVTHCVAGQLERFILGRPEGEERIRKGFQLAPSDPTVCFVAGLLDAEQGQAEAAFDKLSRAVELKAGLFSEAAYVCINHLDRPDLAVMLAGENSGRLNYVANALSEIEEHEELAEKAQAQVVELLKQKCSEADAPASVLASVASIYRREGDNEAAIEHYRRALAIEYGHVQWRLYLARLLAETGRIPEAIHEAKICLRLRPKFAAAENLIADLSILPGAVTEDNPSP